MDPTEPMSQAPTFHFDPPKTSLVKSVGFALGIAAVLTFTLGLQEDWGYSATDRAIAWTFCALFGLALGIIVFVSAANARSGKSGLRQTLSFYSDRVRLERPSHGIIDVLYEQLYIAQIVGRGRNATLQIGGRKGPDIALPTAALVPPSKAEEVLDLLDRQLTRIGVAPESKSELEGRRAVARMIGSAAPRGTITILAAIVGMALLQWASGPFGAPMTLLVLGANNPALALGGEWWRWINATFLHISFLHLLVNGFALWVFGRLLEPLLGKARFVVVFFGAAFAGAVVSSLAGGSFLSVGASGGLFGLLGAYAFILLRWPQELPRRPGLWTWPLLAWILVAPDFLVSNIDRGAHYGGAAAGFVLAGATALLGPGRGGLLSLSARGKAWLAPLAMAISVLVAGSYLYGLAQLVRPGALEEVREKTLRTETSLISATVLGASTALDPDSTHQELELARERLVDSANWEGHTLGSLSALSHVLERLGDTRGAVERAVDALGKGGKEGHRRRVIELETEQLQEIGPVVVGPSPMPALQPRLEAGNVVLDLPEGSVPAGSKVHILCLREGEPTAFFALSIGEDVASRRSTSYHLTPIHRAACEDRIEVSYFDSGPNPPLESTAWERWSVEPSGAAHTAP